MRVNYFFKPICFFIIISQLFLSTSCMGKAKNAYNSESDISYSNEFIQYAEDLTEYAEDLTEYAEDLTEYSEDLTEYAEDFTYLYLGEYTDGIYSVQLQSQKYIKAYLEINGVHTIDIEKIIAQLGIGAGTIIITAFVLPALPVLAGVTSTANYATRVCIMAIKLSKEAVVGAAFDAAISGTMKYYETNGDIKQTFYSTIEKSSEGFMWAAIISSGMEAVKEVKFVHQAAKEKKAVAEILKCEVKNSNIPLDKKVVNQIAKNNTDDLIKILEKVPDDKRELVYRFFASYPDEAANLYAKYQDNILNIFEKIGKNNEDKLLQILKSQDGDNFINLLNKLQSQNWKKALDILSNASLQNQKLIYKIFTKYGDDALELYTKYQDNLLILYEKLDNVEYQNWLINSLKKDGDNVVRILKEIPDSELKTYFSRIGKKCVGENEQNFVYRVIRADENPEKGLLPKNPDRNMSVEGHVVSGSRNNGSQYISTTTDINVAKEWAKKDGCKIVKIDLNKLPDNINIYDLSTKEGREIFLKGATSKNFAKASNEVLLEGSIPSEAITVLK